MSYWNWMFLDKFLKEYPKNIIKIKFETNTERISVFLYKNDNHYGFNIKILIFLK